MQQMSNNNMDIAVAIELLNFQRQPKKGGGLVTVGVASPHFDYLINQAASGEITHLAALYIIDKKQYDEIKNRPDAPINEEFLMNLGWVKDTRLNDQTYFFEKSKFTIEFGPHGVSGETMIYNEYGYHDGLQYSGTKPSEAEYCVLAKLLKIHE